MENNTITIENARIIFRNFSGKASQYNTEGNRNFCVILEDRELVKKLIEDGWNVRWLKPREDGDEPCPYLRVKIGFPKSGSNIRPPKIVLVTSRGNTILDEDSIAILDWAEIANVDMIIRPRPWDVGGNHGIKAYLRSIYVTIMEDDLEKKYSANESSAIDGLVNYNGPSFV